MDCTTPGLPVQHQLLEFTQTHVHRIGDAIQPSHSLSSLSPPALNLSQHQDLMSQLFASGGQNIGVSASASVLPKNIQDWSPLEWTDWISLQSRGLSRVFSNPIVWKSIKPFPLPYFLLKGGAFKHDSRWSDGRMKDDRMDRMVGRDRYRWIEREYTPQ